MPISNYLPSSRLIQPGVCTSSTRPASPYEGQCIYQTDTNRFYYWDGSSWVYYAGDTPKCEVYRAASLTASSNTAITWDTENYDSDGMFTASSDTVTIKTAGVYAINIRDTYSGLSTPAVPNILVNNVEQMAAEVYVSGSGRQWLNFQYRFAANDTLKYRVYFASGSGNNQYAKMTVTWIGSY